MKYLSVCSGIEAATVAWMPLGWEAFGFSENDKFPSSVLQHHYPKTPNFGDINAFRTWPKTDIDVLVGGTPCQSFSVAGLRKGMADPRGNLALVYCAIAERYSPDWVVWENVPGVLSSHEGRDFGAIIGALVELGYRLSYRVLDAQYFGVPQRRCRVFLVGRLGDWRSPAKVLLEPQSLRQHPPPSREARQGATYDVAPSIRASGPGFDRAGDTRGQDCVIAEVSPPLTGNPYGDHESREGLLVPNVANPLTARMHKGINTTADERQTPIVVHASQDPCVSDQAFTLGRNRSRENAIAFAQNQRDEVRLMDKAGALAADVYQGMAVRRLTPLECERLQGFPDGYTDIPGASDTARYKALGNSMAVPVMRWIGERIATISRGNDEK